jgi:D-alanyl-D-alanine carboxypeptidase/D-alanyl-D-alanine-endopeptidase (penicillin-binding protein 4)
VTDPQQPQSRRAAREAAGSASPGSATAAGAPLTRRHFVLIATAIALAFVLLGTGAVFAGIAAGSPKHVSGGSPGSANAAATRATPADRLAATSIPTCSISVLAGAANLLKASGSVVSATTGKSVYSLSDTTAVPPASGLKVLTAAAAIAKLGPDYRITTQVVDEPQQPGAIVLVGQGDPTLSAAAAGGSVYAGAPSIANLATAALTAYNTLHPDVPLNKVILDASYWDPADNWDASWLRTEQTQGYQSEVTALQVDGDRQNPKLQTSPRGTDPVMTAGKAFVAALGLDNVSLATGHAENGATPLASVQSQPVSTLVKEMLLNSDNTLAEMLARIVSVKESLDGSSSSLQKAITTALGGYGVDTAGLTIIDGSGESPNDSIPTLFMAKFMAAVSQGKNGLQAVAAGMPLAGKTGGLATRFTGANAVAAGKIYAKPGFLAGAYTLSGYLTAKDGTPLAFSFAGVGPGITSAAQTSLDTLATGVYNCGKNLSGN